MSTDSLPQAFALALQHHQAGRLAEAEALYRKVLSAHPDHPGALHRLGNLAQQHGRFDLAIRLLGRAVALEPRNDAAQSHLGEAWRGAGRFDEAMTCYRRALAINPHSAIAHYNLGNVLLDLRRSDEAIAAYRQALHLQPARVEAWMSLGGALVQQGRFDEALAVYRRVLELAPGHAQAHFNLGGLHWECGRRDEGVAAWRRALELQPDFAETYYNLGNAHQEQGQLEEAVTAYQKARKLGLPYPQLENNLGLVLSDLGRMDEAILAYLRALEIEPGYALACNNLGVALAGQGRLDEAITSFRRGLDLKPEQADAHSNLIYTLHSHPGEDDGTIAREHERWERQFGEPLRQSIVPHTNDPDPRRRLRIGYVSPAFRFDSPAFFLAPLLENHDRRQHEIYCYASVRRPDELTARFQKSADVWHDVGALSDTELAERIRQDEIDILVDLSMHTVGNRLLAFARRPAPVQVSWLAYPGTTGLGAIDFRLTDGKIDPPDGQGGTRGGEAMRLPDAWCCYAPLGEFPAVRPLPAARRGFVTFGSLNQFCKINDALVSSWVALLGRVPGSRLLTICPEGEARQHLRAGLAALGVAGDRVELIAPRPWVDYVQLFQEIDVALDSFPCNGMTTTCHTLWMGVPVVTRAGKTAVSRAGSSLLHAVGLPEWVARTEEECLQIAVEWSSDLPRLADLRAALRPLMQSSPLMDAPRFARNIESAYRAMWRGWCAEHPSSPS